MMTIEEAIKHAREVAEENYKQGFLCHANPNDGELDKYIECGREHEQLAEWLEELKWFRDLQEQGRLLEFPCAVGETVYEVQKISNRVQPLEIISIHIGRMGEPYFYWELKDGIGIYQNVKGFGVRELNKTVFLTREEAKKALEG